MYGLLERARLAEAQAAAQDAAEVRLALAGAEDARGAAGLQGRTMLLAGDPVGRALSEACGAASAVLGSRLRGELAVREQVCERAAALLAESRVQLRQVEETLAAKARAEAELLGRREQAEADERYLAGFVAGGGATAEDERSLR